MKKKIVFLIFLILLLCTFSMNVFAKEKVDLNIDKNSVNFGDEITVSINFCKEEQVAYAYTANLSYDEDVFETIETDNFEGQENWSDISFNSRNNKFALINKNGESGKELVQIKLKVKNEAKVGNTTIAVKNITATDGEKDIYIDGVSKDIEVIKRGNATGETIPSNTQTTVAEEQEPIKTSKKNKDLNVFFIILIVVIIASIVWYDLRKKSNKQNKVIYTIVGLIIIAVLLIPALKDMTKENPDVDKNGVVDEEDASNIINYLLEIKDPEESNENENAQTDVTQLDANMDGQVTTADVGKVLKKAKSNKTVSNGENKWWSKNSKPTSAETSSSGSSNSGEQSDGSSSQESEGQDGNTSSGGNTNTSSAGNTNTSSGGNTNTSSGENTNTVPDDDTDIKQEPVLGDSVNSERNGSKLKVTFDIQDSDGTLESVKVYLTDENGNVVDEKEIPKNENSVEFDINETENYKVKVEYTYDLGDGKKETKTKEYDGIPKATIKVNIANCKITDNEGNDIYYVQKEQPLKATFTIETNTDEQITYITVNSIKLPVTDNGDGTYTVSFNAPKDAGKVTVNATNVEFETSGDIEATSSVDIEVLKSTKPVISGISVVKAEGKPVLAFIVTDEENTFVSGKVVITDEKGRQIQEFTFDDITKTTFTLDNIDEFVGYNVKVEVKYDLDEDKTDNKNTAIVSESSKFEIEGNLGVDVSVFEIKEFDTENSKIILKLVASLTNEEAQDTYYLEQAVINDIPYGVKKSDEENTYIVEIPYTEKNKQELILQEVILNNSQGFQVLDKKLTIFKVAPKATVRSTVLRDVTQEWLKNITATVKIEDPDATITKGTLHSRLLDPEGKQIANKEKIIDADILHEAQTELNFETETPYKSGEYLIEVYADYNTADGETHNGETIGTAKVQVLKYATIEKAEANKYVEKGKNFDITYTINSNTEEYPTEITINGEKHKLETIGEGRYKVTLTAPENPGLIDYSVTRLIYSDSEVSAINTTQVDVLRTEKPKIDGLSLNDENPEKPVLSFKIIDTEETFVKGVIIITTKDGSKEPIALDIVSKNDTVKELQGLEEGKEYSIKIDITYDMDSDHENGEHQATETLAEDEFEIVENYGFEASNFVLEKVDTENKVIRVKFTSTNTVEKYDIKSVMINGKEYQIKENNGNEYVVEIPYEEPATRQELKLEEVILTNSRGFTDLDVETITVFKQVPNVTVEPQTSEDSKEIKAKLTIQDSENIITSMKAQLVDETGKVVATQDINRYSTEVTFTNENGEEFAEGKYSVKVLAEYEANNGDLAGEKVIGEAKVTTGIQVEVIEVAPISYYVEKENQAKLKYKIKTNTNRKILHLLINGEVITPDSITPKADDGTYEVTVTLSTPDKNGEYQYILTEIVYEGVDPIQVSNTVKVEVLKNTEPTIDNLAIKVNEADLEQKPQLSFSVIDPENTFVKGKIVIEEKSGEQVQEPITFDNLDNLTFEIEDIDETKEYTVKIYLTYDFDTDNSNGQNETTEKLVKESDFKIRKKHKFTFSNLAVKEITADKVTLEFDSTLQKPAEDKCELAKLVINNESYDVHKQEGTKYTVEIPYTEKVRTEYVVEKALLNTLYEFEEEVKEQKVVVFKKVSAIVIPTLAQDRKTISVEAKITDEDNIAKDMYVALFNEKDEQIDKKEIPQKNETVVFENVDELDAGKYKVKVFATYDAVDGQEHNNEMLVEGETIIPINAEILNSEHIKYANKNQEIELTYKFDTNSALKVKSMIINAKVCEIIESGEDTCKVRYKVRSDSGIEELKVTKVVFENEETIDLTYTSQVEILKSIKPLITGVNVDDTQTPPTLSFNITDPEETFISGKIIITDKATGQKQEKGFSSAIGTTFALENIKEFNKYDVDIEITYAFDRDKTNQEYQKTETLAQKSFELIKDYQFKLEGLKVKGFNKADNKVQLEFTSSNASEDGHDEYVVDIVTINGKPYKAKKGENKTYTVEVPYETDERQELKLESTKLTNLKEFTGLTESVVIFKTKPKATLYASVAEDLQTINANINLIDDDETVESLEARLYNPKGDLLTTKAIDNDEYEVTFTSPETGTFKAGAYKIEIGANYNAVDGFAHETKEEIGNGTTIVPTKAKITEAEAQSKYVEKGNSIEVKYRIESNNEFVAPSAVNVNSTSYQLTETGDGTYTASIAVPSTGYGENTCEANIVMFGDETAILESTVPTKYYLLKNKPSIENYTFNEKQKEQTITFDLKNEEEAILKNEKIVVKDEQGETQHTQNLESNNTIELKDLDNGKYIVALEGTFDLDDDGEDGENVHQLSEIFDEKEIQVISKYEANLEIQKVDVNKQNKNAKITFTSENSSNVEVKYVMLDGQKYEAKKQDDTNTYVVEIPYGDDENYQKKEITAVVIENDIEIELKQAQSYEIFKDKPTVTDITTNTDGGKLHLTFKINDNHSIAKNMKAVVTKEDENVGEVTIENKDQTEVDIDNISKAGKYKVEFLADYDRVNGEKTTTQGVINENEVTFEIAVKPEIKLESISPTDYVTKGGDVTLKYIVTSNTDKQVTAITLDNEEKTITDGDCTIILKAPSTSGTKTYTISAIKLGEDSIEIENNEASIYVLKDKPSIANYNLNVEEKRITFDIENPDEVSITGKAILKTVDGKTTMQEQDLIAGTNTIDLNGKDYKDGEKYKLIFEGKCDLDDTTEDSKNEIDLSEIFKEEEFQLGIQSQIEFDSFTTKFPQKGKTTDITFNITSNTTIPVSQINVNDNYYDATLVEKDKYKITYTAKNEAGYEELKVNKLKHGENEVEVEEKTEGIEVLKEVPIIYQIDEISQNYDERKLTLKFTLNDTDHAVKENQAFATLGGGQFRNSEGNGEIPVHEGQNEITFENVIANQLFLFEVKASYDLDSNPENNQNHKDKETLFTTNVMLIEPKSLDVRNIEAQNIEGKKSKYLNRNEEFKLSFTATTVNEQYPVTAVINEKTYTLEKDGDIYTTHESFEGYSDKGKKNIKIESVTLNSNQTINTNVEGQIEVLKVKLNAENLTVDTSSQKAMLKYDLKDDEDTFVKGKIELKDSTNEQIVKTIEITNKDTTEHDLQVEEYKKYKVELFMTYDLDEDHDNTENQAEESFGTIDVELINNYNLQMSDLIVTNVNKESHIATLQFKSQNATSYQIKRVKIGEQEYAVTPGEDNTYTIEYTFDGNTRTEIKISHVILDNDAEVEVHDNNVAVILKNAPTASNIQTNIIDNNKIEATFEITDDDSTLTRLNAILKDEKGNIISEHQIETTERKVTFNDLTAKKYKVEIQADYDAIDGETHISQQLIESETLEIKVDVTITTKSISTKYPEKGEPVSIVYTITSNLEEKANTVTINDLEYTLEKENDNDYKVTYKAKETSGIENLKVTRIRFEEGTVVDLTETHEDVMDVLKTAPTISKIEEVEDLEHSVVMFNIDVLDADKAITSGKATVNGEERGIHEGNNNIMFQVTPGEEHILEIDIEYDLDENILEGEEGTNHKGRVTEQHRFTLLDKYDLSVETIGTFNKETASRTKYFAKNSSIQLRFNSTNKTTQIPTSVQINELSDEASEGVWYQVNSENGYYYIDIPTGNNAEIKKLEIVAIKLTSGKIINKDKFIYPTSTVEVDILKDKPEIQDVVIINKDDNVTITFNVIDADKALINSYIKIVNNNDGTEVYKDTITKGVNNHKATLEAGNQYTLTIEKNYNLSNDVNDETNKVTEIFKNEILELEAEPNFIARNMSVPSRVPNGKKVLLTFENEIMSYKEVESIKIDGQTYKVKKDENNVYSLELDPGDVGVHKIHVESVQMAGKEFKVDRYLLYVHECIVPTVEDVDNLEIKEDQENALATIDYKINDPSKSIRKLTAYLRNSTGKLATTKNIENFEETNLSIPLIKTYKYSIELVAEYDIGDGTIDKTTLFLKSKEAEPFVSIAEESINKDIVNKGEMVAIRYKISTNIDQELRKIYIGDTSYSVTKALDDKKKVIEDTYEITVPAPRQSGIFKQEVTQMIIGNTPLQIKKDPNPVEINVRKSDPTLTQFIVDEVNKQITFKLNDEDKALTENATLNIKDDTNVITTKKLNKDKKEFEFSFDELSMENNKDYNVSVNATYDLIPTEKMNILQKVLNMFSAEENTSSIQTQNIFEKNIRISGKTDYEFNFADEVGFYTLSTNPDDKNNRPLEFHFTSNVNSDVEKVVIDGKEYPVTLKEGTTETYNVNYVPEAYESYKESYYEKIILKNGIAFDASQMIMIMMQPQNAVFEITEYNEDLDNGKVKFGFKLTDPDDTIKSDLQITLKDTQNKQIGTTLKVNKNENYFEFDIPNPPTSKYNIKVDGERLIFGDYSQTETIYTGQYDSKVTTSVLSSTLETRYPKKGEIITIDYAISSTRVVVINEHDQANLHKAVSVTSIRINGKDYEVDSLGNDKYRINYVVQENSGVETIDVEQVNFSNGESEEVNHTDKIDVLKLAPTVENYRTENDVENKKVKFFFKVSDPDGVLGNNTINAEVNGKTKLVNVGENEIEFDNIELDKLLEFKVKATYDLDTNSFNNEDGEMNYHDNEELLNKPFILTGSYDIDFSNINKFNSKGEETEYFEKNEDIKVSFDFKAKNSLYPESITIDGQSYNIEKEEGKESTYFITIKGYEYAGKINANINSVTLNSGNIVELSDKNFTLEILKDIVSVDSFNYSTEEDNEKVKVELNINDKDESNEKLKLSIKDEFGEEITPSTTELKVGTNTLKFTATNASKYFITITSTYNRDSNPYDQYNHYEDTQVAFEVVTINTRYIEMKDIMDVQLYRFGDSGHAERVESLTESNLEILHNCLVKVTMRDLHAFYSEITSYEIEDGKLKLKLAYEDAKVYTPEGLKTLEVTLDILEGESYSYKNTFKSLVEEMRNNPDKEIVLDRDYDLADYETNNNDAEAVIDFEFSGEINGNGHTISNLHKPLFRTTKNAKIKNLVLKNTEFTKATGQAVLLKTGSATEITNVHIDNVVLRVPNRESTNATFAIELNNNSTLQNSSAININYSIGGYSAQTSGGVVTLNNSKVLNCYVQGKISSGWRWNSGLVSFANSNCEITNNIMNVAVTPYFKQENEGNGAVVSSPNNALLKNNLSLLELGNACTIYSNKSRISENSENNYQLEETTAIKNEAKGIETIQKANINAQFFRETLKFNEDIWNIPENASFDNLPTLKGATASYNDGGTSPDNPNVYIPDYNRLSNMKNYEKDREIVYHNMYKLMPFYDAKEILTDGNKITDDADLTNKIIKYVLAYNNNNKLVTTLTTDNYKSLSRIKVVFEDETTRDYNISFDDYYGNVASYVIPELRIGYNFNRYVMDSNSKVVKQLIQEVSTYEFTKDLDPVTSQEDSRLYKEYFDNTTKNNISDFVKNTLTSYGYIPTFNSDVLDDIIKQDLSSNRLKQLLFTYNYFKYWYDLDMDGVEVADTIMFHGDKMFNPNMTISNLTTDVIKDNNATTTNLSNLYNNTLF